MLLLGGGGVEGGVGSAGRGGAGHWISTRRPLLSTCCPVEQTQVPFGQTGMKARVSSSLPHVPQRAQTKLAAVNKE